VDEGEEGCLAELLGENEKDLVVSKGAGFFWGGRREEGRERGREGGKR